MLSRIVRPTAFCAGLVGLWWLVAAVEVWPPYLFPSPGSVFEALRRNLENGLIQEDEVMDRETLPKVQMPNRNAFPASDEIYMDMWKRGCIETYGECRDP